MQVSDHVHAIKIPFQVRERTGRVVDRYAYTYLVCGEQVHLIDCGVASSEVQIFDYLRDMGRGPDEISTMILTHSHPDHIGAARAVKRATGCTVLAHEGERTWIEDVDLQSRERPVPGFRSLVEGSVGVDRAIGDGEVLDLEDGLSLEVFHTPGHSRGSVSLFLQEEGVLFSGDAIPVPGDLPIYEDASSSLGSVGRLLALEGVCLLLSSWDEPRAGEGAYRAMEAGLVYLRRIHRAVSDVSGVVSLESSPDSSPDPMGLCRLVLCELGLPGEAANPLVARSFLSNLELLRENNLSED